MVTVLSGDILKGVCREAKDIVIAAPYIKANALSRILSDIDANASLVCVTRWQIQDVVLGASDIESRTIIQEHGGAFRLHPTLHAKYYRADEKVFIGSTNITYSALGWASYPNLEILCSPDTDFDSKAFEQMLLDDSREIGDDEFAHWQAIESNDFQGRMTPNEQPRLDGWLPRTRDPHNLLLAYRGLTDNIASVDEQRGAMEDLGNLRVPEGLTNEQVGSWVSMCLLASPFVQSVLTIDDVEVTDAANSLANKYELNLIEARRSMETVQNWFTLLISEEQKR